MGQSWSSHSQSISGNVFSYGTQVSIETTTNTSCVEVNGVNHCGNTFYAYNNRLFVDGVEIPRAFETPITINVNGNNAKVQTTSGTIVVKQNAASVKSVSGSVRVEGDVLGSIHTVSGSISHCSDVNLRDVIRKRPRA